MEPEGVKYMTNIPFPELHSQLNIHNKASKAHNEKGLSFAQSLYN